MAMPDRRKLAAPVLAQAASFVVVLVIGGFTGHPAPSKPVPSPTAPSPRATSPSPPASAGSPPGTKGHQAGLTVEVPTSGGITVRIPVEVLDSTARHAVAAGDLAPSAASTELTFSRPVPPGSYQVCVQRTQRVQFSDASDGARPGWVCTLATVPPGGQATVTFHLASAA